MDFNKLTWRPQYYDGQIPTFNTETRRGANFAKSDPGYVPWWAHNGLQIRDNDWDLNISYYSNQMDMVIHYLQPLNQTSVLQALTQPVSSVSTTVQTEAVSTQHMITSFSSSAPPTAAPIFESGLPTRGTSASRYTGTARPTYSRIVTSDGRVRRSKQGASLPPRRFMQFTASRMCCPGDENIIPMAQEESKDDEEYDTPTAPPIGVTNAHANSGTSTLSPSEIYQIRTISSDSTSLLKTPVQRPSKSTDQLKKKYLKNITALTYRDEEEWLEAVTILKVDRLVNDLSQEEQRTIVIIDEYCASMRADQARQ
jgi:hypothetical protein